MSSPASVAARASRRQHHQLTGAGRLSSRPVLISGLILSHAFPASAGGAAVGAGLAADRGRRRGGRSAGPGRQPHDRQFRRSRDRSGRTGDVGRRPCRSHSGGAGRGPALCPPVRHPRADRQARRQSAGAHRSDLRQAGGHRHRSRARARPGQQPAARHHRGSGGFAHPDEPRSCRAAGRCRSALQAPRCVLAGRPRPGTGEREGCAHQALDERGARRQRARLRCTRGAEGRGHRPGARARRP